MSITPTPCSSAGEVAGSVGPPPVVVDADPGIDDAEAIGMVIAADRRRELRLLAITVTFGNSTLKHCYRNTRRILSVHDRLDVSMAGAFIPPRAGVQVWTLPADFL